MERKRVRMRDGAERWGNMANWLETEVESGEGALAGKGLKTQKAEYFQSIPCGSGAQREARGHQTSLKPMGRRAINR